MKTSSLNDSPPGRQLSIETIERRQRAIIIVWSDARRGVFHLWDSSLKDKIPEWDYGRIVDDGSYRLQMFQQIDAYGFAILDGVPVRPEQIERLASIFGYVRETHYGRVFDLIATPQQRILAQTAHAIRPHNDELFRSPIPGLFMMHCLRASECGGGA